MQSGAGQGFLIFFVLVVLVRGIFLGRGRFTRFPSFDYFRLGGKYLRGVKSLGGPLREAFLEGLEVLLFELLDRFVGGWVENFRDRGEFFGTEGVISGFFVFVVYFQLFPGTFLFFPVARSLEKVACGPFVFVARDLFWEGGPILRNLGLGFRDDDGRVFPSVPFLSD